jgi:hypothetical protein
MTKRTIILKGHDRELPVEIVVEPTSKTIHVRVEWIDTQLLVELVQDQFVALVNDDGYKIWLHTINRQVEIGNERCEAMIEICEATFTVELREDALIIKPLERPRYA